MTAPNLPTGLGWGIVLAGGQGTRLRSFVRELHADERPKQFARLYGDKSLLGKTLERIARVVPPSRMLVVASRGQERFLAPELVRWPRVATLIQPMDRGTAAAILWPALVIAAHDPNALLGVFPSDHLVRDDVAFARHVASISGGVEPGEAILVGAPAESPDPGFGWIERGTRRRHVQGRLYEVRSFIEKPSPSMADTCYARGDLWNTMIVLARARAIVELVASALPHLARSLAAAGETFEGTDPRVEGAFEASAGADFSRDVLQPSRRRLLASRLPPVGWMDLGTPERVRGALAVSRP